MENQSISTEVPLGKLALALSNAQNEFKEVTKDSTANVGTYSYNYATLPAIIDAAKAALQKNELSYVQMLKSDNGQTILLTKLMHSSGASLDSEYRLPDPSKLKPQEFASYLTYSRRYALTSMLGIAADEDEDGAGASGVVKKSATEYVMPFGAEKGQMLKDISTERLLKTKAWAKQTDAKKFKSLIDAIDAYFEEVKTKAAE